ncbi:MAG: cytochrome c1 [Burkholderiaceae bacterium]|jgi:ubiquinol-cytochrome c reductase cytochrome c1 subunit
MKKLFVLWVFALTLGVTTTSVLLPGVARASSGEAYPLSRVDDRSDDLAALQRGARLFVNYCLNCHGAAMMRYNRLHDIGLSDAQIKQNLLFATDKVGETMKTALDPLDGKEWFGAAPPDLSVIVRAKSSEAGSGADYLYSYLRSYYRDDTRATGWNNLVFPNVGMPHVLWELQGQNRAIFAERKDPHDPSKITHVFEKFETVVPGTMKPAEFDSAVTDLVSFLSYVSEPVKQKRIAWGVVVLIFLMLFTLISWRLSTLYWKDVK